MKQHTRLLLIALTMVPALGLLLWLSAAIPSGRETASAAPQLTPTPTPTPVFTATLTVSPDKQYVMLGETLVVTLSLTVSEGCQYPVYEAKLTQDGHGAPNFAYVDPITDTVGPGVQMPFTYTLEAIAPGYVRLGGLLYGERYCDDFWNWTYIRGTSPSIRVEGWPYAVWLPAVAGGLPDPAQATTISRRLVRREQLQHGPTIGQADRIDVERRGSR